MGHRCKCGSFAINHPGNAPRDGTQILGDFGWPWLLPCAWSKASDGWVCAVLQSDMDGDYYFENEWEDHSKMIGWIEIK